MTWHHPHLLWLLLALPLCIAAIALGATLRKRASGRFGSEAAKMVVGRSAGLRATRAVLLVLGLGLAIVALARPQYGSRTKLLSKRGVDVVIALDFSKSMLAQDIRPSRIERAKAEIARFISELAGDRIGVVAFAGDTMEFPMTIDYAAAALFFRELTPADMPVGGTAIGRALTAAKRLLERSNKSEADLPAAQRREKVVVLMTDGEDHEGDPAEAAAELAKLGAKVFVVALGSKSGEPIPTYAEDGTWTGYMRGDDGQPILSVLTPEAEQQLKAVAETTGGAYFAPGRGGIGIDQIRKELRGMKQVELQARRVTVHEERYALVLLLAFVLILLEALLPEAWFRRPASLGAGTGASALALLMLLGPSHAHAQDSRPAPAWLRSKNGDVERGNERLAAGDADGALKAYDEAARALPSEGGVHLNRGLALLKQGKLDAARDALRMATDSSAGSPEVRSDAFYDLGIAFYRQAEAAAAEQQDDGAQQAFREASDAFRKALRQKPGNPDAAYNYELTQRRIVELEKKKQQQKDQEQQDQQNEDQQNQDPNQDQQQNQDQQNQDPNQDQQQNQDQQNQDQQAGKDQPKPEPKDQGAPKPEPKQQEQQQQQQQAQQAQEAQQDKNLPPDAAKALDALQQSEKNLEQQRAMQRAGGGHRRPPAKDW